MVSPANPKNIAVPVCNTYFGRISVCVDVEANTSTMCILNYLLLNQTEFTVNGIAEEVACTHNYVFILVLKPSLRVFRHHLDSHFVDSIEISTEEEMKFVREQIPIKMTILEPKSLICIESRLEQGLATNLGTDRRNSYADSEVPELMHLQENKANFLEELKNFDRPKTPITRSAYICCTDSNCYLVTNNPSGPSLWVVDSENPKESGLKKLQIGCEEPIVSMKAGKAHVLLLSNWGMVFAFGTGTRGELGHGSLESELMPKLVDLLSVVKVIQIACGSWHSVALTQHGDVYVWGWNCSGQLDDTDSKIVNFPFPLDVQEEILAIAAYRNATALQKANGELQVLGTMDFECQ